MKSIKILASLFAGLVLTTACSSDRDSNPVYQEPSVFQLNTPAFVNGTYDLENSTTPSHEYGHGMGLNHPTEDYSNSTERPDIMIPRNALYGTRWSIENEDGERVVNTNSRKVLPQNVQDAIDYGCGDVNNIIIK
jgi:hypothetical protein